MTWRYFGHDPEKLPLMQKDLQIYCHKAVDTKSCDNRECQFHAIYDDKRYVITATYYKRRKLIELRCGKKKERFLIKCLSDPGLFPLRMQD